MLRESVVCIVAAEGVGLGKVVDELAIVGSGHGMEAAVVGGGAAAGADRGGCIVFAVCDGGRCGCMAGDALIEVGVEFIGLRVGETALAGAGGCGSAADRPREVADD